MTTICYTSCSFKNDDKEEGNIRNIGIEEEDNSALVCHIDLPHAGATLFEDNTKRTLHLKGMTKFVTLTSIKKAIQYIDTLAEDLLKEGLSLIIVWDGDDIIPSYRDTVCLNRYAGEREAAAFSFTTTLVQMASEECKHTRELIRQGRVEAICGMASTSPYYPNTPKGLSSIADGIPVSSIVYCQGKENSTLASLLGKEIHDIASSIILAPGGIWSKLKVTLSEIFDDDDDAIFIQNEDGSFRGNSNYGYFLLGVGLTSLTQSENLLFVGMGSVSRAEAEFHSDINNVHLREL